MQRFFYLTALVISLASTSCGPKDFSPEPSIVRVQYSAATAPWLDVITQCTGNYGKVLLPELVPDLSYDRSGIFISLGDSSDSIYSYHIGTETIHVIINQNNSVNNLDLASSRALFSGEIQNWSSFGGENHNVVVWVYPPGEDLQVLFQQSVMGERPIVSSAFLASTPEEMSEAVAADEYAIGVIPNYWQNEATRTAYLVGEFPVLLSTYSNPDNITANIISCIQRSP